MLQIEAWRNYQRELCKIVFSPGTDAMPNRVAAVMMKNGILPESATNNMPPELVAIVKDSRHPDRMEDFGGPYLGYDAGGMTRGLVALTTLLLQPDSALRKSGFEELVSRYAASSGDTLLLAPTTFTEIEQLGKVVSRAENVEAMAASLRIVELLEDDFFFRVSDLRQSLVLKYSDELPEAVGSVLSPNHRSLKFMADLPVWCPSRQGEQAAELAQQIVNQADSLADLANRYFRFFGHLPLSNAYSLGGLLARWMEVPKNKADVWTELCGWLSGHSSPLAAFHALQTFAEYPEWIKDDCRADFLNRVANFISDEENATQLRRRTLLAKHFCWHLETIELIADGDSVSAMACWFAEYVCHIVESCGSNLAEKAFSEIDRQLAGERESQQTILACVSPSMLRAGIKLSDNIWADSIVRVLSRSECLIGFHDEITFQASIRKSLSSGEFSATLRLPITPDWAFTGDCDLLVCQSAHSENSCDSDTIEQLRLSQVFSSVDGAIKAMTRFSELSDSEAVLLSRVVQGLAYCGQLNHSKYFEVLSDPLQRRAAFSITNRTIAEGLFAACCEIGLRDGEHDWAHLLPHFLALEYEQASEAMNQEIERNLVDFVFCSSVTFNNSSAIDRLIFSDTREQTAKYLATWELRLLRQVTQHPRWAAAKCRAALASLSLA